MNSNFSVTDQCFLFVLILGVVFFIRSLQKPDIRLAWKQILQRPLAVSAFIVLIAFLIIGVLDSLHWQRSTNSELSSESVLDTLLAPLGTSFEKTYSAPMALRLHNTEIIWHRGQATEVYPKLVYPDNYFKSDQAKRSWVKLTIANALCTSLLLVGGIWGLILSKNFLMDRSNGQNLKPSPVLLSVLLTLFISFTIILASYQLSRHLHIMGTGKIGEDIFYYTIKSIRTGLVIGILTTLFMMPLALLLGVAAGYFGGVIDDIVQYIYTTLSSIPGVLLISASVLSLQTYIANHPKQFTTLASGADARLLALCFILGLTSWTNLCRLLRAETLKLREIDFVLAAKALGSNSMTIMRKHLLPNVMHIVLITFVLDFSFLVLAESVLSYVGVGVSPMTISWGNMINAARLELSRDPVVWWPMMAAFIVMFILVLASNLFADAVRDAFDPHRR